MSLGREAAEEFDIEQDIGIQMIKRQINNGTWIMKNGDEISIREMTDSHIQNCINLLQRKDSWIADAWVRRFDEELNFRKYIRDIATGALEEE